MCIMDRIAFWRYTKRKFPLKVFSVTLGTHDGYSTITLNSGVAWKVTSITIYRNGDRFLAEVVYDGREVKYLDDVIEFSIRG